MKYISMVRDVRCHKILDKKVVATVWMEGGRDSRWPSEQHMSSSMVRNPQVGAGTQVSTSFPASSPDAAIAGGTVDNGLGFGL